VAAQPHSGIHLTLLLLVGLAGCAPQVSPTPVDVAVRPTATSTPSAATAPSTTVAMANQASATPTVAEPSRDATSPPPLYLGLDAYRHWDKLAYLEIGDRVSGQSTADPGGSNSDNIHVLRVLPDGQRVLLDQIGPGVVTFMRMQQDYGGPWNLYLDGVFTTTFATRDLGQLNPTSEPARAFPYPLSLNPSQSQGSSIVATTIPFRHHITWAAIGRNGNFYALYRKLPYGTPLTTWSSTAIGDVVGQLRLAGTDIAPAEIERRSGSIDLAGKVATTITTIPGPRQIRGITFRVPDADKQRFGNARLQIYWDNEATPSVDAPIKFLTGDGAGIYRPIGRPLVQGWIANAGTGDHSAMDFNLYWPMPFTASARIAITTDEPIEHVAWSVRYEPFTEPPSWWGTFHATFTSVPTPTPGQDLTFLDVTGSGKIVGTVVNFSMPDSTLEGDPHIYIDDNQTPQIQVTGTEEWGLGGEYWNNGTQTSLPLGGLPSSINNPPGADRDGAALYRFLIADSIPFNRHVVMRWEHGGANESTHAYRAAIFWYGTTAQTAELSDELRPADAGTRRRHNYQSPNGSPYQLTAAFEYPVAAALITMTGISTTGVSNFTMALDPNNVGAFLRRTFDDCVPNQRANISIDGQFVGTWYSAGSSDRIDGAGHPRCWREEEFPLPAAVTRGKSSVRVGVAFVPTVDPPNTTWTEFRYQMYSFVMPQKRNEK
jgi:Protein of unknown function (DUF2961)